MASDVYRSGRKDVHRALQSGGVPFDYAPCRLDGTGDVWTPVEPPGTRCSVCFAGMAEDKERERQAGRVRVPAAASVAGIALVAAVGFSLAYPGGDLTPLESPGLTAVVVTPSPTHVPAPTWPPVPTWPPLPTPEPTSTPKPTNEPEPDPTPIVLMPTLPPIVMPTLPPLPTLPIPECRHPGQHVGVKDVCLWPGNR